MNNAEKVVARFGGQNALARLLNKGQSTVQHWCKTGNIPTKWQASLIELAQSISISLSAADLVPSKEESVSAVQGTIMPQATFSGTLQVGEAELPCYVLSDGRRVISRTGATTVLTSAKGGGNLESYTRIEALQGFIPTDLPDQMIEFSMPGVSNKTVMGMSAETFLEICKAYARARDENALKTDRQKAIAVQASMFLAACAKIGLIALIDEATGYQYERAEDALRFKLKVYLEEEMRKWEKTFPDELWREFGRLTNWSGSLHQRPKYWGKLVMELVYGYLDKDVAEWLKKNAPKPRGGQNYHQWLSSQYGLKKLVEHLWMLVGMASACTSMSELREKMADKFGRVPVQLRLFLPPIPTSPPGVKSTKLPT